MSLDLIHRRLREQLLARGVQGQARVPAAADMSGDDLHRLHCSYQVTRAPLTFHRRILGRLLLPARWLVRELLTPALARQTQDNAANARLVDYLAARSDSLDTQLTAVHHRLAEVEELIPEAMATAAGQFRSQADKIASRIAASRAQDLESYAQMLSAMREQLERCEGLLGQIERRQSALSAVSDRQAAAARAALAEVHERIGELGGLIERRLPPRQAALELFDYAEFEDRFRGGERTIREHLRRYKRHFQRGPVLELGCGRGEFLELMREAGVCASGVDLSPEMVARCRGKGLDVTCADAIEHLEQTADGSLGGIFSAQFLEHLTAAETRRLLVAAWRKLRPGAVLVAETLNPEALMVQYRWFWLDPTHVRLLHPEGLRFALEAAGFSAVQCHCLQPPEGPLRIPPLVPRDGIPAPDEFNRATDYLNRLLFSGNEYYAVAIRPEA